MSQTTVDSPVAIGSAGQAADLHTANHGDVISGTSEETSTTETQFGLMVKRGTNPGGVKNLSGTGDVALLQGIAVRGELYERATQLGPNGGPLGGITFGVARTGRWLVIPEADGTESSGVHVRVVVSGGNTLLGAFTPTAEVGKTIDITPFAHWHDGGPSAGEPSVLEIDMPNAALAEMD
jgi:hypothetical protein